MAGRLRFKKRACPPARHYFRGHTQYSAQFCGGGLGAAAAELPGRTWVSRTRRRRHGRTNRRRTSFFGAPNAARARPKLGAPLAARHRRPKKCARPLTFFARTPDGPAATIPEHPARQKSEHTPAQTSARPSERPFGDSRLAISAEMLHYRPWVGVCSAFLSHGCSQNVQRLCRTRAVPRCAKQQCCGREGLRRGRADVERRRGHRDDGRPRFKKGPAHRPSRGWRARFRGARAPLDGRQISAGGGRHAPEQRDGHPADQSGRRTRRLDRGGDIRNVRECQPAIGRTRGRCRGGRE